MSWNLSGIILHKRWADTAEILLDKLGLPVVSSSKSIHITDAPRLSFTATAIACHENYTLVLNRLLPYDLSFNYPFTSPLDERLKLLSATGPVLAFLMDGISSTYGFCIFEKGVVIRARQMLSGRLANDYGDPLPEEDEEDEEARVFALTGRWIGTPLDDLFFDPSFHMKQYDT